MTRAWAPLLAGHVSIGRRRVPVRWSSPDLDPLLRRRDNAGNVWIAYSDLEGARRPRVAGIVLCASMSLRDYPATLLHEVLHCVLWPSYRGRKSSFWSKEHEFIRRLEPTLTRALLGWAWRPLPLPPGHASLARHARAVRATLRAAHG